MSTRPAEMVRLGSIFIAHSGLTVSDFEPSCLSRALSMATHHNSNERVEVLLVGHLGADVDTAQPAAIPWVRVIPANGILQSPNLSHTQVSHCVSPCACIAVELAESRLTLWLLSCHCTMNSYASSPALTLVSVPCTGSANASMM